MGFTTNGKERETSMHPFGRASPSVINHLIKAGSLLSPTCSSGDIRAIPSISQAATPMKPRANLGNRTRQPKGCANRIANQPQKNKWRSHIGGTGWDRHKKRGWTQSHGQSKNTHYIPGFIHPQRVPSRIRTGNSPRIGKRARKPRATNTPTRAIGTMCEIKRRYQQASRIGLETESHLT